MDISAWLSALSASPALPAGILALLAILLATAFALAGSVRSRRRLAGDLASFQTEMALATERLAQARLKGEELAQELSETQERAESLASENRDLVQNNASLQSQVQLLQIDRAQLKAELSQEAERHRAEAERRAQEAASLREENAKLLQQAEGFGELQAREAEDRAQAMKLLEARLGDFGRQMLAERAEDLRKRSEQTLAMTVAPLAQQLDGFRSLVARTAQSSSEQEGAWQSR